jgi:hypothetical protein
VHKRIGRPSPALAISLVSLFVALGGVGYAAATINSADIANNTVSTKDIKNGTIAKKDINKKTVKSLRGQRGLTGPAGPQGAAGAAGAPGSALAYARVKTDGTVDPAFSKGVTTANVELTGSSLYCFDLPFTVKNVTANVEQRDTGDDPGSTFFSTYPIANVGLGDLGACNPGTDAFVVTSDPDNSADRRPIMVLFN